MKSWLLAAALAAATCLASADEAAVLRAMDQALLDAIAPGDRATWDRALADDAVYVDENGTVMDRAAFLAELSPLPAGLSGHIAIVDYRATVHGDTALVVQTLDEREDFHGLALRAGYLMTETWRREAGAWRLAMVHAHVTAPDPPAILLPAEALDAYVGRYVGPGGLRLDVVREGDHLMAGKPGGAMRPLQVEWPDQLFTPGQPRTRKHFRRDAEHRVTGFIDRREGEDIPWTRTP